WIAGPRRADPLLCRVSGREAPPHAARAAEQRRARAAGGGGFHADSEDRSAQGVRGLTDPADQPFFFAAARRLFNREAYPTFVSCFARPMTRASSGTSFVTVVPVAT